MKCSYYYEMVDTGYDKASHCLLLFETCYSVRLYTGFHADFACFPRPLFFLDNIQVSLFYHNNFAFPCSRVLPCIANHMNLDSIK